MLKVLAPTLMLVPTTWLTPYKWLWPATLAHSLLIATVSLGWLNNASEVGWSHLTPYMATDPLSAPLLVLSCWLLPLMILASQGHVGAEPISHQRWYITLLTSLQIFLIMAFSATELMMFYIMFEATLIPTLVLITRWGNQTERFNAGTYFLFYTLVGSIPLLIALFLLKTSTGTLSLLILGNSPLPPHVPYAGKMWWTASLLAFLVKMPLYSIHLWLPKAHVEAPVAGSMVLAAVLLKLGGYGMMRMLVTLEPSTPEMSYPFLIFSLWGVVMAGSICLRQTDLKSLIAYSSVSHMGLVIAGILSQTPGGFTGALMLMIAHGLTSSALFCLANMSYERTHTRKMVLNRGTQLLLPLTTAWWFIATLANLALPPFPNLMGELMIMTSLFKWNPWTLAATGTGMAITAAYSLYMLIMTQWGKPRIRGLMAEPSRTREHLLMTLHLLPLILLIIKPYLIWGWSA
uniref:NADH-ubiquinone oxidoreductase chain 4 n=1 Tax=Cryptopsaras couesii TaxID=412659 RepID=A0A6B9IQH4_CRYCE|nr:NADH dehydrogenase subunit 4 [Cryptopsaras couesii]QGZ08851.1 NADH dehydrogenase subunit 4 [Cryptopsaras couesii]